MVGRTTAARQPMPAPRHVPARAAVRAPVPQHSVEMPRYHPVSDAAGPRLDARYDATMGADLAQPHALYRPMTPLAPPRPAPEPRATPAEEMPKREDPPAAKAAARPADTKPAPDRPKEDRAKPKQDKDSKGGAKAQAKGVAGADAMLDGDLSAAKLDGQIDAGVSQGEEAQIEERKEAPGSPPPARAPTTGGYHLNRPAFRVRLSPGSFGESRELGVEPATPTAGAGANAPAANEPVLDYRSLYADAVEHSHGLYRRLNDEALRIVADADRRDRELASLHQAGLDASLLALDGALADSRTRLAGGSEQLRMLVEVAANRMRGRIGAAAGGAIAALEARLKLFRGRLDPLQKQSVAITGQASTGTKAVKDAGDQAIEALGTFALNAEGGVPQKYGVMQSAIREAQVTYAPGYAQLDQKTIKDSRDEFDKYLTGSFKCLDCDFDRAFQSLEGQCDTMRVAGPKAVYAAQDGALKAVDNAVDSLRKAIDANEEATERGLVAQHQRTREGLIATAEANAGQESEALAQTAERQGEALVAMASGQPNAVQQMRDMIAAQARLAPPQFGQAVSRATARLRSNLAGIGAKQPRATADNAARIGASQLARAHQFEARQRGNVRGTELGLHEVVEQALGQLDQQIGDTFAGMDNVPADVRASCNAYLAPAGPALDAAVQELADAVGAVGARVHQVLNGGSAIAKHEAAVKDRKAKEPPPKPPAGDKGKGKPPPAAPAEPATCGGCGDDGGKADKKADTTADPPPPDGAKSGTATPQNDAQPPAEGDASTPAGFKAMCEKIKGSAITAPQVAAFLKRAEKDVPEALSNRTEGVNNALATRFAPDTGGLMANLRGLTARQGQAICYLYWKLNPSTTLEARIHKKYFKDSVLSSGDTDQANYDAAIRALRGRAADSAMSELVAAFNYSNENQRIRDVLLNLTPKQLDELKRKYGKELKELATQLDGEDLKIFNALLEKNTAPAKANALLEGIDKINAELGGVKRGDAIAKKLTEAQTDFHHALEGDPDRKTADIFHFEAQTDAVKDRNKGRWEAVQTEFAKLEPVKAAVGTGADPKAAILDYATRKVAHTQTVAHGRHATTTTTYDTVNDYHKEWIRQVLDKGADSIEAKGARLLVEEKRDKADLTGLDAAIHSGAGDAREGGGYDKEKREAGKKEAEEERKKVFEASEAARAKIEKTKPMDAAAAQKRLEESFAKKLSGDEAGKRVALGMLKSDAGDPAAVMDYAIKHEKSELALMQLRRMDRVEIREFVTKYNKDNRDGPGLYQKLGVFQHHGKSGTVFDGDEANELTIAFMGVPQNDKERGEVALKTMKLTTDQSGALGRGLANEEYQALLDNARRLKEIMGVTDAEIDAQGFIKARDRDGNPIVTNFDAKGNFVPKFGGDTTPFETAVAMAKVTSSAYTQATDRIANFITTALMVIAAVVTTVLTGGAAASLWIPVLVTAGAGLIGMALTASIKGDRYTRAEMVRDLAMTIVQAATAGIGAAVGAGLRGGTGAVKALASSMRVSEQALAKAAGQQAMLRGLTLAEEMAIGAGSSALSGGVAAAVDPAARKGDDYGMGIFHGMLRGAIGGAAGAGVTRGVSSGIGSLAKGVGARTGASAVLARGGSLQAAARVGQMRARALGTSALTEIGTRSLASGLSGAATRMVDLGYNATILNQKMSAGAFFEEIGWAFVQNAVQGAAEGAGDRTMRRLSGSRAAEHAFTVQDQGAEFKQLGLEAMVKEGRRRGLIPPADPEGPEAPTVKPKTDTAPATEEKKGAAAKKDAAPTENLPAIVKLPKDGTDNEEAALTGLAKLADPEGEPLPPTPKTTKTSEDQIVPNSLDDSGDARTLLKGANDNGPEGATPMYESMDLSKTDMVKLGKIPAGSVFIHPDSTNVMAANDNFGRMILADPGREVAHLYNPVTGESLVVQGNPTKVAVILSDGRISTPEAGGLAYGWARLVNGKSGKGHWELRSHYHPNLTGKAKMPFVGKLPSGAGADFGIVIREARDFGLTKQSSRIYYIDKGKIQYTQFGIDLTGKSPKYWVDLPNPWPWGGTHTRKSFKSMKDYHKYVARKSGHDYPLPANHQDPPAAGMIAPPKRPRALESGSAHQRMTVEDVSDLHVLHDKVKAGDTQDAHDTVRQMGLVGEPDSMARLNLALNERSLPLEVRQSLADTVFAATRDHMIAKGELAADDQLHMFFHGAPEKRTASLKDGGIDLGKVNDGSNDDFGKAFYLTSGTGGHGRYSGLENAELYSGRNIVKDGRTVEGRKGEPGEVFAFFLRGKDLGTVVDVTKGGKHRAAWEEFLDRTPLAYPAYGSKYWSSTRDFLLKGGIKNRGDAFDAFLKSPEFAAKFGAATAHPDLVVGTLGESGLTNGIGRGDQAALRVEASALAARMNEQIGFGKPAAPAADDVPDGSAHMVSPPGKKSKRGGKPKPELPAAPKPRVGKRKAEATTGEEKSQAPATELDAAPAKRGGKRKKQPAAVEDEAAAAAKKAAADEEKQDAAAADDKQSNRKLDPDRGTTAARKLAEATEDARRALDEAADARWLRPRVKEVRESLAAQKPPKPPGVDDLVQEALKLETQWNKRAALLAEALEDPDLSPDQRRYLEWLGRMWTLSYRIVRAEETTKAGNKTVWARDQEAHEAHVLKLRYAENEAREANLGLKERMRKEGENYRHIKKTATRDAIMDDAEWDARQAAAAAEQPPRKLPVSPDHLVSLDEIANMPELTPIFDIYGKAPQAMRDEIEQELRDLGDLKDNLVPMWSKANVEMKNKWSWNAITYEQAAKFGYSIPNVERMRREENAMRVHIKGRIADIIAKYRARLVATGRIVDKSPTLDFAEDDEEQP